MTHTLILHSEEETSDLIAWLYSHVGEEGVPERAAEAAEWLDERYRGQTFPLRLDVPQQLLTSLYWAIEDWSEIISAHREEFHSSLEPKTSRAST
jgi:hypothetical protein